MNRVFYLLSFFKNNFLMFFKRVSMRGVIILFCHRLVTVYPLDRNEIARVNEIFCQEII